VKRFVLNHFSWCHVGPDYVHGLLFATVRRNQDGALAALPDEYPTLSSFETKADSVKVFPLHSRWVSIVKQKRNALLQAYEKIRKEHLGTTSTII
jgi:hypothetical protein